MSHAASSPRHPVVIVTGANSGIGFGICHRLLVQLALPFSTDTLPRMSSPQKSISRLLESPFTPTKQLTLVMACRNTQRASAARQRLLELLDTEIRRQKKSPAYDGHAEDFRRGLRIDCLSLDLANMDSVFDFAEEANFRYPYITHLILNAGIVDITAFAWGVVFKQILTEPMAALTTPQFMVQRVGAESSDGLGLVWQSNVFGHYALFRLLEPLLFRSPYSDARVEWLTSIDVIMDHYDPADPQLRVNEFSYEASKCQIDLMGSTLARTAAQRSCSNDEARIRHLLVHPGVCSTNMTVSIMGVFLETMKLFLFYLARLFGSQNHPIQPYKGAAAAVHVSLVAPELLKDTAINQPCKYGSKTTMWGKPFVNEDPIDDWRDNAKHGASIVELCEKLFTTFSRKRGDSSPSTSDSGIVVA